MKYTDSPPLAPGAIALVTVRAPFLRRGSTGKIRPALLVRRDGGSWTVVGLTTLKKYSDGRPRCAVPNPSRVGLRGPGYVWGRGVRVSVLDVDRVIGWADPALVRIAARVAGLSRVDRVALLEAAHAHHAENEVA